MTNIVIDRLPSRRKAGRPNVPDIQKRKHAVTCRLTDAESWAVDAARGSVSRGEYIRLAALLAPPRVVPAINREAWTELSRVSANLNQLLRSYNSTKSVKDGSAATAALDELRQSVEAVRLSMIGADMVDDDES